MSLERRSVSSFISLLSWIKAWLKTLFFQDMPEFSQTFVMLLVNCIPKSNSQGKLLSLFYLEQTVNIWMRCHQDLFHGHAIGQCSNQTFPTFFFFFFRKGSPSSTVEKKQFVGESRSLQTLTSLLLWNKKSPQTEKIFLAKIMSIPGTGNTSHFFVLLLWCFLSLFLDFPFLRESTCTHQALKYLNKEKALFFRIESFATSNIPEMSDNSNCFEQRILACSISQMQWGQAWITQVKRFAIPYLSSLSLLSVSVYVGLQHWTHPYMKAPYNFEKMEDILV